MSFEEINISVFNWINATAGQNLILDKIALFSSHNLITFFIVFLLISMFFKDKNYRNQFAKTIILVLFSLIVTQVIHLFYYHPRPFELGLGHTLVGHGSTSSVPSQHTLTIAVFAFSYLMSGYLKIGILGMILSIIVGWSRVYIGVHFPLDVLSSFLIAFTLVFIVNMLLKEVRSKRGDYLLPPIID